MNSDAILYISLAAVLCTGLVTCSGQTNKPTEAMITAAAGNCTSTGQSIHVRVTATETKNECVKPAK